MKKALVFVLFTYGVLAGSAQLRLPALIRDSMVLQRAVKLPVWGWAAPLENITVQFKNKSYKTITGTNGKWKLWLPAQQAGGPYTLQVTGSSSRIALKDILIGDVWVCAGQSNMVHTLRLHAITYAADIAQANYPAIRQYYVPTLADTRTPREDLPAGHWTAATAKEVPYFSAVAFFFARTIYEQYKIPIGIINASVGGTPIEAWTSEAGLQSFPDIIHTIQKNKDTAYINGMNRQLVAFEAARPTATDHGLGLPLAWYDTAYQPRGWQPIQIPGYWEDQGIKDLDGIVWYRREIELPPSITGIPATVFLGRIVDADFLYVNGELAGSTGYQYPQRRYALRAGLLKPGKNIFVIRVVNNSGKGGFVPDKPYYIAAGGKQIDLKGDWQYKVGAVFEPVRNAPAGINVQNQPTALFNAMIAPLLNHPVKGVLWYQGESNTEHADVYAKLLPALIADWRQQWQQDSLPFLFVQLPNFMEANYLPAESHWAELREAQRKALSVPHTAMAVTIDLGEWNDIHPDKKKEVGIRLALAAEKAVYGNTTIVSSGPLYLADSIAGNKIIVRFSETGSGLVSQDGEALSQFAIAGRDKKFVWAHAKIEGNTVIVWNDQLPDPLYVRYAWADNPSGTNLYNKEGLPASPFQTDTMTR